MNALTTLSNPYLSGDFTTEPFAGRQKAFEFLYQQLMSSKCGILMGRRDSGKTAVLRHFSSSFSETFTTIYLPHKELPLQGQNEWLLALAEATLKALMERNLSLSRLVKLQPDAARMREWFGETFLPEVTKVARVERLAFLLDDAGALAKAVQDGRMPSDHFIYMDELKKRRAPVGFVLAMDSRFENDLALLSPLASQTDVFRLENLSEDETAWLLREPVKTDYTINDEALKAVYRAAGGQPRLLQRFGSRLYSRWDANPETRTLIIEDVKAVMPQVYNESVGDFQRIWDELTRNERLTLAAISQLGYADPLAPVDAAVIERWQLESSAPLDMTAIHAAIRALEYADIVAQTPHGLRVVVGLMQTWLLENERASEKAAAPTSVSSHQLWWAAIGILIALVLLLALIAGQQRSDQPSQELLPTVTLVSTPTP
jgi:hypothetical protein